MVANVWQQFIEAALCFGIGAYFGIKYAFTEIIGECSGKILRGFLNATFGISYIIYLGVGIYIVADGNFEFYHLLFEILGTLAALPLCRKILIRFKPKIQKFWLCIIGDIADKSDTDENENAKGTNEKQARINPKNTKLNENAAELTAPKNVMKNNKFKILKHDKIIENVNTKLLVENEKVKETKRAKLKSKSKNIS